MADNRIVTLLRALYIKTQEGKLKWQPGPEDTYLAAFSGYGVSVRRSRTTYYLELLDSSGEVIDSSPDTRLTQIMGAGASQMMQDLFEMARRSAHGVDKAIDKILGEIQGI
jgi:hypothetical protein